MFVGITNDPRDYAWGSSTAIADLLGRVASGKPEAELWYGAHPASPSRIENPDHAGGQATLDHYLAATPAALGEGRTTLPFLLKILAAESALSLQVHPTTEQAKEGYAREQAAGIPVDAPERNYRDESAKPEIIVALSPTFEALAGFRHVSEDRMLLAELAAVAEGDDADTIRAFADRLADEESGLKGAVEWLLRGGPEPTALVAAVVAAATAAPDISSFAREFVTVGTLAGDFPGDPGVVLSLLLNRVSLAAGQGMALEAGIIHAYLAGLGVELMTSSDNVLRGGLTPKHVDVDELLKVVRWESTPVAIIQPDSPAPGVTAYRGDGDDFVLAQVTLGDAGYVHGYALTGPDSTAFTLTGPAIAVCITGGVGIRGAAGDVSLGRGDAVYISPDERTLTFAGSGSVFVATTP